MGPSSTSKAPRPDDLVPVQRFHGEAYVVDVGFAPGTADQVDYGLRRDSHGGERDLAGTPLRETYRFQAEEAGVEVHGPFDVCDVEDQVVERLHVHGGHFVSMVSEAGMGLTAELGAFHDPPWS
jgi:hypothetical protein